MIAIVPLLLVLPVAADVQALLNRAGEEAEMFHQNITLVIGQEKLKQRAQKRSTRFRPHVVQATAPAVNFQTRELISEYAVAPFAESNGNFHEVRQVTHIDGRQIQKLREARMSLAMGMKSADDKLRRKLLLEFDARWRKGPRRSSALRIPGTSWLATSANSANSCRLARSPRIEA